MFSAIEASCKPRDNIRVRLRFKVVNFDQKDQLLVIKLFIDGQEIINKDVFKENGTDEEIFQNILFSMDSVLDKFDLKIQLIPLQTKEFIISLKNLKVEFIRKCPAFSAQLNDSRCRCIRNYWENQTNFTQGACCTEPDICFECLKCWDNLCDLCSNSFNGSCLVGRCNTDMEKNIEWKDGLCVCRQGFYRKEDRCYPCHDTCYECFNQSLPCTSCWPLAVVNYQNTIFPIGHCICPSYTWVDYNNTIQPYQIYKCRKCYYRCPACLDSFNEEEEMCQSCVPPLVFNFTKKKCTEPPSKKIFSNTSYFYLIRFFEINLQIFKSECFFFLLFD